MRDVSIGTLISKSVDRTTLILFKPFLLKKWLCLLLIATLAGAIGGGSGGRGGEDRSRKAEAASEERVFNGFDVKKSPEAFKNRKPVSDEKSDQVKNTPGYLPAQGSWRFFWPAFVLIVIGVLVCLLIIVFTWIGARFRFIWFESIVKNDASIKAPFKTYQKEGSSLFKFFTAVILAVLLFFGLIALWIFAIGTLRGIFGGAAEISFGEGVRIFALPALALFIGIPLLVILGVFVDDFVVTIMAMDRSSFSPAWRKFVAILKENRKDMIRYLLVLIGLWIISGVMAMIIAFLLLLLLFLAGGILFGLPYLLIVTLLKVKLLFIVYAVIIGIPFAITAFLLLLSANLPFAVFFRSFSLYFLSSLEAGYVPLPLEDSHLS